MKKISLEIVNLSEVTKFMSPLVDINYSPFDFSWFPRKEENILSSKSFVEENFLEEYKRRFSEKSLSASDFKKECKILKIYDIKNTQSESRLFYRYEIFAADNNPIVLEHCHELLNESGGSRDFLWIEKK